MIVILILTIALFIWGKLTPHNNALMPMLSLFLFGILDLIETLSSFNNPTVIMIAALFIIGEGLSQTGWTALAGQKFIKMTGKSITKLLLITILGSGVLSGFVSNTGTVSTTTNAIVMTAGEYKFIDYLKVGTPLLPTFLIITLLLAPPIWPV